MKTLHKLAFPILLLAPLLAHAGDPPMDLHDDKPAADWNQALPVGNGFLGAMEVSSDRGGKCELIHGDGPVAVSLKPGESKRLGLQDFRDDS